MLQDRKVDVIGPENRLFAGASVLHSFSPEILQAGAVKGLKFSKNKTERTQSVDKRKETATKQKQRSLIKETKKWPTKT